MFHRAFPDIRISATTLERVYRKGGVKYKAINKTKKEINFSNQFSGGLFNTMYDLLQEQKLYSITVIYLDEAVFTFNTFLTKAWSSSYKNISVREAKINVRAHALVAGVSEENGMEGYHIVPKAINSESYIFFLRKLKQKY